MKKKILIIEDDSNLRDGVSDLLSLNNYEVHSAHDGMEGLKTARKILPDLILCDIMMPKLDGYQLKEIVNGDKELSVVPFIFLTAKSEMKDLREGLDLGADDYIIKPFDTVSLLSRVETKLKHYNKIRQKAIEQNKVEKTLTKKHSPDDMLFINLNNTKPKVIRIGNIKCIEASGNYCNIYMNDGNIYTYRKTINSWEESLEQNLFLRIHRSIIINMNFIYKISRWSSNTYLVYICDIEEPFTISQRYATKIRSTLKL